MRKLPSDNKTNIKILKFEQKIMNITIIVRIHVRCMKIIENDGIHERIKQITKIIKINARLKKIKQIQKNNPLVNNENH